MHGILAGVILTLIAGSCGTDGPSSFDESVAEVRVAVGRGDRDAALAGLEALAIQGLAAHDSGDLTDTELDEFAARIESSRQQIEQLLPTTTTIEQLLPTTTTTASTAEPPSDGAERGKKEGHDKDD